MKKIKTFEDACRKLKLDPVALPDVSMIPEDLRQWMITCYRLAIITKALNMNEDGTFWEPDWNSSEHKWYPWFYLNSPGFRFCVSGYELTYASTTGGSRLCFKSEELSTYAGKKFLREYEKFFTAKK